LSADSQFVLLIPAHNEAHGIEEALSSVEAQTRVPDRKIVIADNCTDDTVGVVCRFGGWEVWTTEGNAHKKAGALNQGYERLDAVLTPNDYVMVMDADSYLDPGFIQGALDKHAEGGFGGVGGTFRGRPGGGFVGMLQRNEYARYGRETRQKRGRVMVLTGTATVFRVDALRAVIRGRREKTLPPGDERLYDTEVLTEDNELSLALRHLGYKIVSPKQCTLSTEVMEAWADLATQRIRWKRGALENCRQYGLTRITLEYWYRQILSAIGIVATTVYLLALATSLAMAGGLHLHLIWIIVSGVFVAERVISVRRRGLTQMAVASVLLIEMTYDIFLQAVHAKALWETATGYERGW
jgi:cellulose synthase/poly-beta-1,6-N-acetylglucosamine synthase-like glycosyltransferase